MHVPEPGPGQRGELDEVVFHQVGEGAFQVRPDRLDRVKLGDVGREPEDGQPVAGFDQAVHLLADVGVQVIPDKVPHLVFRADPGHPYFPGPEWWDISVSPAAPAPPLQTTGICQPPVHALAVQRIWQLTPQARRPEIRARIHALYPRLVRWHHYLATNRDPEASGLVTTFHPWEGTDNSPRWDSALKRITVAKPGP